MKWIWICLTEPASRTWQNRLASNHTSDIFAVFCYVFIPKSEKDLYNFCFDPAPHPSCSSCTQNGTMCGYKLAIVIITIHLWPHHHRISCHFHHRQVVATTVIAAGRFEEGAEGGRWTLLLLLLLLLLFRCTSLLGESKKCSEDDEEEKAHKVSLKRDVGVWMKRNLGLNAFSHAGIFNQNDIQVDTI